MRWNVIVWELDYKESWELKNRCFWTMVLEKTLKSPLDCKEIKPVNPKGNQSWVFIGRTDAWSWSSKLLATWCEELIHWKRPWCWERVKVGGEGTTEDEMVGCHHWFDGHEFEQALGVGARQGSLSCSSPWGLKEVDTTEWLNWTMRLHIMNPNNQG